LVRLFETSRLPSTGYPGASQPFAVSADPLDRAYLANVEADRDSTRRHDRRALDRRSKDANSQYGSRGMTGGAVEGTDRRVSDREPTRLRASVAVTPL
jgi:hypothetical protein